METNLKDTFLSVANEIKEITKKAKAQITELQKPALKAAAQLFSDIGWNDWSEDELENPDQYARLQKSFTDKMELISIDHTTKSGQVRSSAVYDVSGKGCTCKDCSVRRLPCKHMYFLAFHLAYDTEVDQDLQLKLDEPTNGKKTDSAVSEFEVLGCCSLFRDCSKAGHCLHDDDYHKQCGYRKNLESGNAFYTEKASNFSQERYDYIEGFRNSLIEDEKCIFDAIMFYFESTKRGCQTCFCLSSPEIKDIISRCHAFEMLQPKELITRIFDSDLILCKKAAELHSKYSKLPAPELKPLPPLLPKTATKKEQEERQKAMKQINAENLKIWKHHFLYDFELQEILAKEFVYFKKTDYSFELGEFFIKNYDIIAKESAYFVFFDPAMPKVFRDKIV